VAGPETRRASRRVRRRDRGEWAGAARAGTQLPVSHLRSATAAQHLIRSGCVGDLLAQRAGRREQQVEQRDQRSADEKVDSFPRTSWSRMLSNQKPVQQRPIRHVVSPPAKRRSRQTGALRNKLPHRSSSHGSPSRDCSTRRVERQQRPIRHVVSPPAKRRSRQTGALRNKSPHRSSSHGSPSRDCSTRRVERRTAIRQLIVLRAPTVPFLLAIITRNVMAALQRRPLFRERRKTP